ncbi:sugar transferase [Endozoicomonas numazuensis]|uniref:Sugar transferase n=1 Tax=Endozoicomonas numazuensis TaxID=1137799 RepID=A0A081NKA5_9GAMM|nr:sugar transferase [Endozoicomonas numazuensis]KEQ18878.1 sugar transferase [Endozoicomonas numazuensis]
MKDVTYVHPITALGKRVMDISLAVIGIILTLPLYPFIAIAIRLDSPGPVFYRQMRIGYQRENYVSLFLMTKFRTMSADAEAKSGPVWAAKNDPRVTKVGHFLRKTRLDELPQLWNVLMGDMSIVGPRPERPGMCHKLEDNIPFYTERTFDVVPGITGLAQVNLSYDETIDDVRNKVAYDHAYALSLSSPADWLKMDFTIMFKTMWVMVKGKGQ